MSRMVIVLNELRDAINAKLDAALAEWAEPPLRNRIAKACTRRYYPTTMNTASFLILPS